MTPKTPAKRPKLIRIFGRPYLIAYEAPPVEGAMGLCDNAAQVIHADPDVAPTELKDTVLHEVLHGCHYVTKLGLSPTQEERVVEAFASALVGVFQDNPGFAHWLAQKEPD